MKTQTKPEYSVHYTKPSTRHQWSFDGAENIGNLIARALQVDGVTIPQGKRFVSAYNPNGGDLRLDLIIDEDGIPESER